MDNANEIMSGESRKVFNIWTEKLNKLEDLNQEAAKISSEEANKAYNSAIIFTILGIIITCLLSMLIGIFIAQSISKGIQKMDKAALKIASGNLDIDLQVNTNDEIGNLAQSFGNMKTALQLLVADTQMLVKASAEGNLQARADIIQHQGDYRKIVEGFNNTLDAIVDKTVWYEVYYRCRTIPNSRYRCKHELDLYE